MPRGRDIGEPQNNLALSVIWMLPSARLTTSASRRQTISVLNPLPPVQSSHILRSRSNLHTLCSRSNLHSPYTLHTQSTPYNLHTL
jgi:hypothetical protein